MALLTPMTLLEARAIASPFGLEVAALDAVPHGSVNSNFALELAGGERAFLRVYEESSRDEVELQNRLLLHLVEHGVPTPAPMERRDGAGTLAAHAGKPVAVFPFCDGAWICQQRVDAARLEQVGEALARVHVAGASFQDAPDTRFGTAQLHARLATLSGQALAAPLVSTLAMLAARLEEADAATRELPQQVVTHGDVFRDNVLWHDDGRLSAVLDFESASRGHPAFDLMVTLLAWCYGDALEQPLARALVRGYQRVRSLEPPELAACYQQARMAAVRFAITRITDYELRPRGVVVYKDYRRFVARLEAVEGIGPDGFAPWMSPHG